MSSNPEDSWQFFLSRIEREAKEEGRPLTDLQRRFLASGGSPETKELQNPEREFDRENPEYLVFMERVTALMKRAAEKEAMTEPDAERRFREALLALEKSESGSPLWFAVVPALPSGEAAIRRGFRLGLITFVLIVLLVLAWLKFTGQI